MSIKEHLLYMLKTNLMLAHGLLDDITEDESMVRGKDKCNHIRWQIGHLIHCDHYSLSLMGHKVEDYDKYAKKYGGGSEISENAADYPGMKELRAELYKSHEQMIDFISTVAESDFEKTIGEGDKARPVWNGLTFLAMHEFYHNGQIANTRKALGRERSFG
jgi:hypothetical protein